MTTSRMKHKRLDPFYYCLVSPLVSNNLKTAMLVNSQGEGEGRGGEFELPSAAGEEERIENRAINIIFFFRKCV